MPVAAVHAERRTPRRPPPVGRSLRSAGSECATGGLGNRLRPGRLLTGTCREGGRSSCVCTELHSASYSHSGTEGRTGGAAGGEAAPSLRAPAATATALEEEEGAERRPQAPQPLPRPPPPRARARAPEPATAAARARAHLQLPKLPQSLALRPHPIGSAHLRPRRQPIDTRLARCVGGLPPQKPRLPPHHWSCATREGRDHLKLWTSAPHQAGETEGACAGSGVSAPGRHAGRPAGSASAPEEGLGWVGLLRTRGCAPRCPRRRGLAPLGARRSHALPGDGMRRATDCRGAAGLFGSRRSPSPLPIWDAAAPNDAPPLPLIVA